SSFPSRKGVTMAVIAPEIFTMRGDSRGHSSILKPLLRGMPAGGEVFSDRIGQSELQRICDQRVADGDLDDLRNLLQEGSQIVQIQIMTRVNLQPDLDRPLRRGGVRV